MEWGAELIVGLTLVMASLVLRAASVNSHVRKRVGTSAVCFAGYAIIPLVIARVPLGADLLGPLHTMHALLMIFGVVNLTVTLAVNPWRVDRVPDRFPHIVQDSIIIGLFALVAMLVVRREFLATTAAGALIVGLALQDTLGNLFNGLAVQIERPFQVGHWVNINGRDGQVSEITWRATKIRTKAGNLVIVPNSVLAKETITNYSMPNTQMRLDVEVGASYDAPPNDVKGAIREALADEPSIDHSRDIEILIVNFADSAVTYCVRVWISDFSADDHIYDIVRSRIYYAFHRHGIVIPYPTRVLVRSRAHHADAPVDREEMLQALKATAFCAELDDVQLNEVLEVTRSVLHAAGEAIVREGTPGSSMFVICAGEARVTTSGRVHELARLSAGDYFGEMSLLTGEVRSATVVAATDCRLLEITADDFRLVVAKDPAIIECVMDVMARRRSELDEHLARTSEASARAPEPPQSFVARVRQFLSFKP